MCCCRSQLQTDSLSLLSVTRSIWLWLSLQCKKTSVWMWEAWWVTGSTYILPGVVSHLLQKDPLQRMLKYLLVVVSLFPNHRGSGDAQSCNRALAHSLIWVYSKTLGYGRAVNATRGKRAFCAHVLWVLRSVKLLWSYFKYIFEVHWESSILL